MQNSVNIKLSRNVTIQDYRQMEYNQDRDSIARFIQERFTERYITPLRGESNNKHGFCTIAVCCLMIESLESFQQGEVNTQGKSRRIFLDFFNRYLTFSSLQPYIDDFYINVRCGIIHQAETRNGWRILRKGSLFDPAAKTINATKFHDLIEECLVEYCNFLRKENWSNIVWINLRKKMDSICNNA